MTDEREDRKEEIVVTEDASIQSEEEITSQQWRNLEKKLQHLSPAQAGKGWGTHWSFPKGKEV